jgi:hypothetical protein
MAATTDVVSPDLIYELDKLGFKKEGILREYGCVEFRTASKKIPPSGGIVGLDRPVPRSVVSPVPESSLSAHNAAPG